MSTVKLHGLKPTFSSLSTTKLILGTIPSAFSYKRSEYYSHSNSRFWKIMASVLKFDAQSDYDSRIQILTSYGYGLWDVLNYAEKKVKTDLEYTNVLPNSISKFLLSHANIKTLIFNGDMAYELFSKSFGKQKINCVVLPSTNINESLYYEPYGDILASWRKIPR